VQWVEPHPGLVDYIKSPNILVPWKERRPFLRDEASLDRLREICWQSWPGFEHPISDAVELVLHATGERVFVDNHGVLMGDPDELERIAARAKSEFVIKDPAFVDRDGTVHGTFTMALSLAQAFAAAEPEMVLLSVELEQRRHEADALESGGSYMAAYVQRRQAALALCRQWAGFDQALWQREQEITRLRRIISDLRYELLRTDQTQLVAKLDRKLKGR
jgi:hypothetical protein